jgi:hypothetical protein
MARIDGERPRVRGSRFLPGSSPLLASRSFRFLDPSADRVQFAVVPSFGTVLATTVRFDGFDGPPIEGDPVQLLDQWQKKLALRINERGEIMPSNPASQPGDESRSNTENGP